MHHYNQKHYLPHLYVQDNDHINDDHNNRINDECNRHQQHTQWATPLFPCAIVVFCAYARVRWRPRASFAYNY